MFQIVQVVSIRYMIPHERKCLPRLESVEHNISLVTGQYSPNKDMKANFESKTCKESVASSSLVNEMYNKEKVYNCTQLGLPYSHS